MSCQESFEDPESSRGAERQSGYRLKAYGLVKPGIYDVVGYAMMSSPDLKSALQHFVRYCSLIDNGVDFSLHREGRTYRLCGRRHGGSKAIPRQFYDVGMAALIATCVGYAGTHGSRLCVSSSCMRSRLIRKNMLAS